MKTLGVLGYVTRETRGICLSPIKDTHSKETIPCERSDGMSGFICYVSGSKDPLYTYVEADM
jgi:hypothetical protein